ncbi:DUF58 domain-containing protein [Kutzneria viridogrisea]|uniref:DUF58 domain-containing protein n=1 Tax=Kutzneria albida DSM 43870 TaxID=1449976 RepID=W5WHZ6_9PSEU|nr:hypothetical protein KALB_7130 [Kutzneria albida DSM 43870]
MLSGLTTRGRCLMAAGIAAAVCSALLNERDLLRIAAFVVLLPLLAALMAARSRVGLASNRYVHPERVPVGSSAEVRIEMRNTGRLPSGGLLLEDGVPYALGARPRFIVERLSRHHVTPLRYQLRPVLRGIQQVGPLMARVTDPFGLAEYDRQLLGHSKLIVVPRVYPLSGLPGGAGMGAGEDGMVRLRSGQGEDDAVVRNYRHGDDMRKVHWRSTARRDELMVRVEETPWRGGTTVLLDHRASAHRGTGPTSSLEWVISFAASVCLHLHRNGQHVRLVTEDGRVLAGGGRETGHSDLEVLDALAALNPSHQRDLVCTSDPAGGQEMVAVLGATNVAAATELCKHRPRTSRSLAVLLDVSAWESAGDSAEDTAATARLLREAGWGVVVAGADTSMDAAWSRLCHAGAVRGVALLREGNS